MDNTVREVLIPAERPDPDVARVHTWLTGQGVTVAAVSLTRPSDGTRRLLIETGADVAPLFANWANVPTRQPLPEVVDYRFATQAVLDATGVPIVIKAWVRALNAFLRHKFDELGEG